MFISSICINCVLNNSWKCCFCLCPAPPRILSLSIGGSVDTSLKALCQVQGSPLPDIQWMGLDEVLDSDNGGAPLPQEAPDRHRTTSQLLDIQPGGQYTCTASNPLGNDQATVYILPLSPEMSKNKNNSDDSLTVPLLFGLALAVKLLLFLGGLGGLFIKWHVGSKSLSQSTKWCFSISVRVSPKCFVNIAFMFSENQ